MEEDFIQNAIIYASGRQLHLAERLGFGIHGIIYVAEGKSAGGKTAIEAHREVEPYRRELSVYQRLLEADVTQILGFNVPQYIHTSQELRVIEMSIVMRVQKLIPSCPWKESVIPLRQFGVFEQVEFRHLLFGNLNMGWVVPGV
jgi:hypothetical protein